MSTAIAETIRTVQYVRNCHVVEEQGDITQIYVEAELQALDEEARTREIKTSCSILGAVACSTTFSSIIERSRSCSISQMTNLLACTRTRSGSLHRRVPGGRLLLNCTVWGRQVLITRHG